MNWQQKISWTHAKNKGFSLIEVLYGLILFTFVILSGFVVLNYTLKITIAARSRMDAFAAAERAVVAALAGKSVVDPPSSRATVNGILTIKGIKRTMAMDALIYKEKNAPRLSALMARPLFIIFLKKGTR